MANLDKNIDTLSLETLEFINEDISQHYLLIMLRYGLKHEDFNLLNEIGFKYHDICRAILMKLSTQDVNINSLLKCLKFLGASKSYDLIMKEVETPEIIKSAPMVQRIANSRKKCKEFDDVSNEYDMKLEMVRGECNLEKKQLEDTNSRLLEKLVRKSNQFDDLSKEYDEKLKMVKEECNLGKKELEDTNSRLVATLRDKESKIDSLMAIIHGKWFVK